MINFVKFWSKTKTEPDPFPIPSNGSWYPADFVPFCLKIQTYPINNIMSVWDLVLFIPNLIFCLFLLFKWIQMKQKLQRIDFPIITVFYSLILIVSLLSISRFIVSMFIRPITQTGEIVNKIVWLVVRLGQLSTELSVVLFGLFFARLESRRSILRIMYLTVPISLIYISIQASLELFFPDKHYIVVDKSYHYYDLYGHGGMVFWFISSSIFTIIYTTIFILPFTRIKQKFPIPTNRSFYFYCLVLSFVCFLQSIGSALVYLNIGDNVDGLCILDLTTYLYFTMYSPLVYLVFLRKFFQKESLIARSYLNSESINSTPASHNSLLATSTTKMYNTIQSSNNQLSKQLYLSPDLSINEDLEDYDYDDDMKVIIVNRN